MRSQPWATSYTNTNTSTGDQNKVDTTSTTMENGLKLPPLKPLSQIDCLAPCRADERAIAIEREANMAKIKIRQKRIIKPEIKEREFGFGRRKRQLPDYPDGSYPPLSQVPMGSNPILETPAKKQPPVYKRNIMNTTRLVPISQISCLIKKDEDFFPRQRKTPPENVSRFHRGDHSNDSTYVKLARSGGQKDLLHYVEARPPLQRSVDSNYTPSPYGGTLPALKSKSVQDPSWRPSQWATLSPIRKKDDDGAITPTTKKNHDNSNSAE